MIHIPTASALAAAVGAALILLGAGAGFCAYTRRLRVYMTWEAEYAAWLTEYEAATSAAPAPDPAAAPGLKTDLGPTARARLTTAKNTRDAGLIREHILTLCPATGTALMVYETFKPARVDPHPPLEYYREQTCKVKRIS